MSTSERMAMPKIVSAAEWQKAHDELIAKEKAATRARDALAAERRRQPMTRVEKDYVFESTEGPVRLIDLFEGRRQLLVYHFMFAPEADGWPNAGCPGCSMFTDNIGRYMLPHLHARNASFALVSLGPLEKLQAYRKRMDWPYTWVSSANNTFNVDYGITSDKGENHGISVFLQDGSAVYRTYFSTARGVEALGSIWTFLDITPFGRQEEWEDSPAGWPKSAPYQWWRRHDEY